MNARRLLQPHDPRVLRGRHEELLFTDLALFNRKLADGLVFYLFIPRIPDFRKGIETTSLRQSNIPYIIGMSRIPSEGIETGPQTD